MRKLLAGGLGLVFAASVLTAAPQPAEARSTGTILGILAVGAIVGYAYHYHYLPPPRRHHRGHIVGPFHRGSHVHWCESRYRTYNRYTDLYFYEPGKQRRCRSPYSG